MARNVVHGKELRLHLIATPSHSAVMVPILQGANRGMPYISIRAILTLDMMFQSVRLATTTAVCNSVAI